MFRYVLVALFSLFVSVAISAVRSDSYVAYWGDVNGDGVPDIYLNANEKFLILGFEVAIPIRYTDGPNLLIRGNSDGSFQNAVVWNNAVNLSGLVASTHTAYFADVDGDSVTDLLLQSAHVSRDNIVVFFNSATSPKSTLSFDEVSGSYASKDYASWTLEDVNGDGKTDLVLNKGSSSAVVGISNGTSGYGVNPYGTPSSQGTEVVGATAGGVQVDEFSGSAGYSIPLVLPAGPVGITPKLSLSYNSRGGNGLLGKGFSLSGLGAIRRCSASRAIEGDLIPASKTSGSLFCLNGERLIATSATKREFRLRIDPIARIKSYGGSAEAPDYFIIEYKSGEKEWFGYSGNSLVSRGGQRFEWNVSKRSDPAGNAYNISYSNMPVANNPGVLTNYHAVDRITYGNSGEYQIQFVYAERHYADKRVMYEAGTAIVRDRVLSSVNASVSGQAFRSYNLAYESAPNTNITRLIQVQECGANNECFKPTVFYWSGLSDTGFYIPGVNNSSIFPGISLTPGGKRLSTFCKDGDSSTNNRGCDDEGAFGSIQYPDVNGDGKPDLCYRASTGVRCELQNPQGGFGGSGYQIITDICRDYNGQSDPYACGSADNFGTIQFIDMNLDQKADLTFVSDEGIKVFRSTGTSFVSYKHFTDSCQASGQPDCKETNDGNSRHSYYPDLNGDYASEICWLSHGSQMYCKFSSINPTGSHIDYSIPVFLTDLSGYDLDVVQFPDYDGDGDQDILVRKEKGTNKGISVYDVRKTGSTYGLTPIVHTGRCANGEGATGCNKDVGYTIFTGNVNGDSNTDICYRTERGVRCLINKDNGNDFQEITTYIGSTGICGGRNAPENAWECYEDEPNSLGLYDLNHDGMDDLVLRAKNGVRVYFSNNDGISTVNSKDFGLCLPGSSNCRTESHFGSIRIIDANTDGRLDLIYRGSDGINTHLGIGGPGYAIDSLLRITNGHGLSQQFRYTNLMNKSTYSQPTRQGLLYSPNLEYSKKRLISGYSAMPVVATVSTQGPVLNTGLFSALPSYSVTTYKYSEYTQDITGNNRAGFASVEAIKSYSGILISNEPSFYRKTSYHTLYPYAGNSYLVRDYYKKNDQWSINNTSNIDWRSRKHTWSGGETYNLLVGSTRDTKHEGDSVNTWVYKENYYDGNTVNSPTQYDANDYGNLTKQITETSAAEDAWTGDFEGDNRRLVFTDSSRQSITTTSAYANNASSWILGRILSTTVVKTDTDGSTRSRTSTWNYDTNGYLSRETFAPGTEFQKVTDYQYNDAGQKTSVTETPVSGHTKTTEYEYNSKGQLYLTRNDSGFESRTLYHNVLGTPEYTFDVNGFVTTYSYDGFGRNTQTVYPSGVRETQSYVKGDGGISGAYYYQQVARNDGTFIRTHYDSTGLKLGSSSMGPDGQTRYQKFEHNKEKMVVKSYLPSLSNTDFLYSSGIESLDYKLRPLSTIDARGNTRTFEYSAYKTITTNAKGQKKTVYKRPDGKTVKVVQTNSDNAERYEIVNRYDVDGNLLSSTSEGITVSNTYDTVGRRLSISDPDKGNWRYVYNALDQMVLQENARGYKTCYQFDNLGRKVARYENYTGTDAQALNHCTNNTGSAVTNWIYDTANLGSGSSKVKGALHRITGPDGYQEVYTYDDLARVTQISRTIKGEVYTEQTQYDSLSRPLVSIYPSGLRTENVYEHGTLQKVRNQDTGFTYWEAEEYDAFSNLTHDVVGNGLHTYNSFEAGTSHLTQIIATAQTTKPAAHNTDSLLWLDFEVDEIGNYRFRHDRSLNVRENYTFDHLNRLTTTQTLHNNTVVSNDVLTYNRNGNIATKSGTGTYYYGETCGLPSTPGQAGPHAVSRVVNNGVTTHYCYDAGGNLIKDTQRELTYATSFEKPLRITHTNGAQVDFEYGPDRSRYYRKDTENGAVTTETFYASSGYEKVVKAPGTSNQQILEKHYIAGRVVEIHTNGDRANPERRYMHKDQVGSTVLITAQNQSVLEQHAYDPWGQKRTLKGNRAPGFLLLPGDIQQAGSDYRAFKSDINGDGTDDIYIHSPVSTAAWLIVGQNNDDFLAPVVWANTLDIVGMLEVDYLPGRSDTTLIGFTGHEQIESVGLVHMGGRLYDPVLARMVNADPFIQAPSNSQSFNRYSYVINNPVTLVDPSGYIFGRITGALRRGVNYVGGRLAQFDDWQRAGTDRAGQWFREEAANNPELFAVAQMAGCAFGGPAACAVIQGISTAIIQQDFGAGLRAGALAYAYSEAANAIGDGIQGSSLAAKTGRVAAHSALGGAYSSVQGGSFWQGAVSAGFAEGFAEFTPPDLKPSALLGNDALAHSIEGALLGGTTGVLMGGGSDAFVNGAKSGAMSRLFNYSAHFSDYESEGPRPISSTVDEKGTKYMRGDGTVVVLKGVSVAHTVGGNTIEDVLTVSENLGKTVYIISGKRSGNNGSEHARVAVDIYVEGSTRSLAKVYREKIHNMSIFNRVSSYHNKNTVHVDYKSTGNQGQFHDSGKGWMHIP